MNLYKLLACIIFLVAEKPVFCMDSKNIGRVASAHPLATEAGLKILEEGGNAFDAAIAVAATLNVVEPMMSGIGGYGTILIYDARTKQIRYLNSSGRFPLKANSDLMRAPASNYLENRKGAKSISTPGNLNAWKSMHETYATIAWDKLFKSAIRYAEKGFPLTHNAAAWLKDSFSDFSEYSKTFYGNNGQPLKAGEMLIQKDLAETLKIIARDGVDTFYKGNIAKKIDKQMKEIDSFLSIEDLQNDKAEWGEPIKFNYKGYDVYTASPPANAFAAFVVLGIMEKVDVSKLGHNSADYLHLLTEAVKESYKARLAYSFDPEVQTVSLDPILSSHALKAAADSIDMNKASDFTPSAIGESRNTTHFVVIDKWGNMVSATQTLGNMFGSRIMIEGTGIWMNSSMMFSTFEPKGNPMDVFPGRHKLSGDCPILIMINDRPWAALGTPGGHTITQNVPQIIFNLIDYGMSMQEAIDAAKISFIEPDLLRIESGISLENIEELKQRGHHVEKGTIGNATGIKIIYNKGEIDSIDVGIDKRRDGHASIQNASM